MYNMQINAFQFVTWNGYISQKLWYLQKMTNGLADNKLAHVAGSSLKRFC